MQPQNTMHKMRLDMNWVILIIAGLCETGFAFCLGKMKGLTGLEHWLWGAGFAEGLAPDQFTREVLIIRTEQTEGT